MFASLFLLLLRAQVGEVGSKKPDYWEPARALLRNANKMKEDMLNYDKDNIPEDIINKITVRVLSPPPFSLLSASASLLPVLLVFLFSP